MNFWNQLISAPRPGTVTTEISLDKYSPSEIIGFIERGIVTRDEVIASGVAARMFGNDLDDYLHQRREKKLLTMICSDVKKPCID